MKKDKKQFEAWANKELRKWQKILLLDSYTLRPIEPSDDKSSKCIFSYPYKDITVKYAQDVYDDWAKNKKGEATEVLIHELCHVFTDPLYAKATSRFICRDDLEDEREALVDHIANIVIKSLL